MKRKTFAAFLPLICLCASALCHAEETPCGGEANLRDFIFSKLDSGVRDFKIPAGQYRLGMQNKSAILAFENLENVKIDASGVELICTDTIRAIKIVKCKNFALKGLTIDYDPLTYTQGKIVAISDDKSEHEIEIFDGYPDADSITKEKYEIFTPDTRILRTTTYHSYEVEVLSPKRFKVKKGEWLKSYPQQNEELGDIAVINTSNVKNGAPHCITMENCENVLMDSVTLYASNCFGFFESFCKSGVYKNCVITRRPAETDIAKRASARVRSLPADAYHCRFTNRGPTYDGCFAAYMGDDAVAISGGYHLITETKGKKLRVLARHSNSMDIEPGMKVEIAYFDGSTVERAKAVKIEKAKESEATAEEKEWIASTKRWPLFQKETTLKQAFDVELDKALDIPRGSMIIASDMTGEGYKVINCRFGFARARGIIVKAPNGIIKNNTLEGFWLDSIAMYPEWFWFGGGHVENVIVEGNKITAGVNPAISIFSDDATSKSVMPAGAHRNVTIRNNQINYHYAPAVLLTSIDGLIFKNNKITYTDDAIYEDRPSNQVRKKSSDEVAILECNEN